MELKKMDEISRYDMMLEKEIRSQLGAHYTNRDIIHKIIDPLFLDELKAELEEIKKTENREEKEIKLQEYQRKLSSLTFLDPACGTGNFLVETFISLRKLENETLKELYSRCVFFKGYNPVRVTIEQFHGIEIDKEAVSLAKKALLIAEQQLMKQTERILNLPPDSLVLFRHPNIVAGNALRIDWESVISKTELNYIIGNPPYLGSSKLSDSQREDMNIVWAGIKRAQLDYASAWFKKAAEIMLCSEVKTAFVSTSSVCQGSQVLILWKNLFEMGIEIDFAYRPFKWMSDEKDDTHVYCVIVGFSVAENTTKKQLFENGEVKTVDNINGYLMDAPNFFIKAISTPICDVPKMIGGVNLCCYGNYTFTHEEMEEFIEKEPGSKKWFKPFVNGDSFIKNKPRYCLFFQDETLEELEKYPLVMERIERVKYCRASSKNGERKRLALKPQLYREPTELYSNVLAIPKTTSSRRGYIPIGFTAKDTEAVLSSCLYIVPDAGMYEFAVLTSSLHNIWSDAFCSRLADSYGYTNTIVYNNFPWYNPNFLQKARIEQTANAIIEARNLYPGLSLAELYDPLTMPKELKKAHEENDRAVMQAYGFKENMTKDEYLTELIKLYLQITKSEIELNSKDPLKKQLPKAA